MFPSFKSLSDKEEKRKALLRQAEIELEIDRQRKEAYKNTLWASDVDNKINLVQATNTVAKSDGVFSTAAESPVIPTKPINLTDAEIQATTSTAEIDIQTDDISPEEADQLQDIIDDEERQSESYKFLKTLYTEKPELAMKRYLVFMRETGKPHTIAAIGKDLKLISFRTGKKYNIDIDNVDWELTHDYIISKISRDQNNDYGAMKDAFTVIKANAAKAKAIRPLNAASDQIDMEQEAKLELARLFRDKPAEMRQLASSKKLIPFGRARLEAASPDGQRYVALGSKLQFDEDLKIYKTKDVGSRLSRSARESPSHQAEVDWSNTLWELQTYARIHNVNLYDDGVADDEMVASNLTKRNALSTPSNSPNVPRSRKQVRMNDAETSVDVNSKESVLAHLKAFYRRIPQLSSDEAIWFKPLMAYRGQTMPSKDYRFSLVGDDLVLISLNNGNLAVNYEQIYAGRVNWEYTRLAFNDLIESIIQSSDASQEMLNAINTALIDTGSKLSSAQSKAFSRKAVSGKGLVGRGLRGAGRTSKNLSAIEGSGSASDLKYRRIGSKFIRLKDLHENKLKLVYGNRNQVGPIQKLSSELTNVIKTLVHDQIIDEAAYAKLSIPDKRLFQEVLNKTHTQYSFKNPITDPLVALKSEFDKLRGEIILGNDSPMIRSDLRKLSIDMFAQKLITQEEFSEILSSLI